MARQAFATLGKAYVINGSYVSLPNNRKSYVLINDTLIQLHIHEPYRDSELNELLYVIIVIVFYATALMTLIITQIKRQRREGTEADYYDEYLQRNSEVKRTCQAATTVVNKPPPPVNNSQFQRVTAALASAAVAAASAGSIMGSQPGETAGGGGDAPTEERNVVVDCVVDIRGASSLIIPGGAGGASATGCESSISTSFGEGTAADKEKDSRFGAVTGGASTSGINSHTPLLAGSSVGVLAPSFGTARMTLARDRSPTRILESIPDEEGEEIHG